MASPARSTWITSVVLLVSAFAFRLVYGLSMPFWSEDERQVYLIGLRAFARGEWPYLGADVVWTGGQLPGALQGWLVGWPLRVWPAPEAPFVLLNLLSFGALALFAWYLTRRIPEVPRWLVWGLLLTCPWTMNFSAHIINTSYVLPGAIVFFIGFLEGMPAMRRGIVPLSVAWALMGAGLIFVLQIHMSWVLLPPYVLAAAIGLVWGDRRAEARRLQTRGRRLLNETRRLLIGAIGLLLGAAVTGLLLAPTIARDGLDAGHMFGMLHLQAQSPLGLLTTAARVLSFASFETLRFLGLTRADRLLVLWREPWIVPFVLVLLVAGVVQPVWMLVMAFRRAKGDAGEWRRVRVLTGATVVLVYASYFLSVRGPQAHAFYVVFPVAVLFALSCWQICAQAAGPRWRIWERIAGGVLICSAIMHAGLAFDRWTQQSLYADRALVAAAIDQRNDRFLGDRRDTLDSTEDHAPRPTDPVRDPAAYLASDATADLEVQRQVWTPAHLPLTDTVSMWSVTITNRSRVTAWLDIRYESVCVGADGRPLAKHEGILKRILQPGETRDWPDVSGGIMPDGAVSATFRITRAERVIPGR